VHTKATVMAETLDQILGGGTIATESGDGGGGLLGAALENVGGGILGSLLNMSGDGGGAIAPSGSIQITPEPHLNALIVEARPDDVALIERLLKVLDQSEGPAEVLVVPKARMIPVLHTQAEEIASVVRDVYQDRMVGGGAGGPRQPSPEEFIRMLRGDRGRGSRGSREEDVQKMSIGVDTRTNSLVVAAPDALFQEVKLLVEQLDDAAMGSSNDTMRVVTLNKASPEAVKNALAAMMGESVQFGSSGRSDIQRRRPGGPSPDPGAEARRAAFVEMMRQRFGGGRGPGGGPPGGPPRGGPPGDGPRGGPRGG
jgi:type II secretory pathway component GspD/PulD (secretin)